MGSLAQAERELGGLPANLRAPFLRILQIILRDMRMGHPDPATMSAGGTPMTNFGGAFVEATTPATPGDEFTIAHGFGRAPYLLLPVLSLDTVGSSIVPLTVSRAADEKRIYLTSSVASAPVVVVLEG